MTSEPVEERNVLGGALQPCGTEPLTGFYRDGHCASGPEDLGLHTVCTVVSADFLQMQQDLGNDLSTPRPEYGFPGLKPGDRWCVVAVRWMQAYQAGAAAGVVLGLRRDGVLQVEDHHVARQRPRLFDRPRIRRRQVKGAAAGSRIGHVALCGFRSGWRGPRHSV